MRKSLGKRLISGVTAALTAVSLFPNVLPNSMAAGETSDINSAKTIFSLDREGALKKADDVTYKYANELYAQLNFVDEAGNPADVKVGDNEYYLLVHAVGRSSSNPFGGYVYKDDESRDYYQLFEIGDGPSWTSAKFSDELRPRIGGRQPATERVDGILLKNNSGGELSLEDATSLKDCEAVDSIGDYTFIPSSELSVRTTPTPDAAYGNDTVAVTAKASTFVADLNVYDVDGNRSVIDKEGYNYYLLSYIAENADAVQKRTDLKGWAIQKVTPDASNKGVGSTKYYQEAVTFNEFVPFGENGSSTEGEKIKYDKSKYVAGTRLFRTLDKDTELNTYADCVNTSMSSRNCTSQATDTIPSYTFEAIGGANSSAINVYKDQLKALNIEFNFDQKTTITADEKYYVLATVEHRTGNNSYYLAPIVVDNSDKLVLEPQSFEDQHWIGDDGNEIPLERYKGTEKGINFELLKAKNSLDGGLTISGAIGSNGTRTDCAAIPDGDTLSSFVVSEEPLTKTNSPDKSTATFTKKFNLKMADFSSDQTFDSILGNGVYFGIVADRYNQFGHAETNFAANYYEQTASVMAPDLAGPFAGHIYIANYYDYPSEKKTVPSPWVPGETIEEEVFDSAFVADRVVPPTDIKASGDNKPGTFKLDTWAEAIAPQIHVPDNGDGAKSVGMNGTGVTVSEEKSDDMKNNIIQPMIDQMKETSDTLVNTPSTIKPIIVRLYRLHTLPRGR